ncbi:MAG: glycosyltransferase [Deltaproteobacteria bacterium]|nr:glycosyltransferase [Deltaproteobacteria bacterium]
MIDPARPDYTNTPVSPQRPQFLYAPVESDAPPAVTIVTPFYNTGPVFRETACSVLQQSFQQWEWLIVNDGSTDPDALALLEPYRHSDPRIRVIDHTVNKGLSTARNTGFAAARTPYVGQLDSDDLLEPTTVEKWLWLLESYPEFAFVGSYSVGFEGKEYLWPRGFHDGVTAVQQNVIDNKCMVRVSVHRAAGGYDETIRAGGEDWDFWLRCASLGYWGTSVPEYLAWYRCRQTQGDRWANLDETGQWQAFREQLRQRYPSLWEGEFPRIQPRWHMPNDPVPDALPCANRLRKERPRLLLVAPWLAIGGADKFNLNAIGQLIERGWEVTIATTLKGEQPWLPQFACVTPDIFVLPHFLRLTDYPRFLRYLIASRGIDVVMVSHSELGYQLLPYLRAACPDVAFLDFCHAEAENWKNGGYPRMAVEHQELLDLNLVASEHLRDWMVQRGADQNRIRVCHINIDANDWRPDPQQRRAVRQRLEVDEETPLLLSVSRLDAEKAPAVLAQTMRQLAQRHVSFVSLVVGDGAEREWMESFIQREGLNDRLRLLGALPNEHVRELLTAADVFFLPSKWEGIALAIYEAMACGIPVVGGDVGGQCELVTAECGILVAKSDEDTEALAYVDALEALVRDRARCQAMGAASRHRIEAHFRLEQMGNRFVEALQEAMRLRTDAPRPVPSRGLALLCAVQAIEYTRLAEAADGLWSEHLQRERALPEQQARSQDRHDFSQTLYAWIGELEHSRTWLEEQVQNWRATAEERERLLHEQRAWTSELERGKAWLEEQVQNWCATAEERERLLREQQTWMRELERGKAWLAEQVQNWRVAAEERERLLHEQRTWMRELERGKAWLAEQVQNWRAAAEERERLLQEQQVQIHQLEQSLVRAEEQQRHWQAEVARYRQSPWGRLGKRFGLVTPAVPNPSEPAFVARTLLKETDK